MWYHDSLSAASLIIVSALRMLSLRYMSDSALQFSLSSLGVSGADIYQHSAFDLSGIF